MVKLAGPLLVPSKVAVTLATPGLNPVAKPWLSTVATVAALDDHTTCLVRSCVVVLFSVVGLVGGSMMPVYGALIGRLFGTASFGQVMGMGALVGLPVIFLAPLGFGYAFDASNSYSLGLVVMIGSLCLSGLLFSLLPKGLARRSGASELTVEV